MKKVKRIAALLGAVLLIGLYIITAIVSFIDRSASHGLFTACIVCTIIIPVLLYAYVLVYKVLKKYNVNEQIDDKKDK